MGKEKNVLETALKTWEAARGTRFQSISSLSKKTGLSAGKVSYMIELLMPLGLMERNVIKHVRYAAVGAFDKKEFQESIGEQAEDELGERSVIDYSWIRENEKKLAMIATRTNRGMSDTLADLIVSAHEKLFRGP